jgi:amino acid transporter
LQYSCHCSVFVLRHRAGRTRCGGDPQPQQIPPNSHQTSILAHSHRKYPIPLPKPISNDQQFYVVSIAIVGLLVPYTDPQLIGRNSVDSKASPFIIAIKSAGIQGLDSVMNAVVMIAVLSVANSSMYGATRTLQALAEQGQAPRALAYVDRKGRPLVAIACSLAIGLLAYLYVSPVQGPAFTWMLALSGLSSIFTWTSICYAHIQFRKAWIQQGNLVSDLIYQSPIGVIGSWVGVVALLLILIAQFWVAISPSGGSADTLGEQVSNFFEAYLAMPVVLLFYSFYKIWYRTRWVRVRDVDLQTGRNEFETAGVRRQWKEDMGEWPRWKVLYKMVC